MNKEIMEEWIKFKDDQFEDNGKLLLAMKELRWRKKDLNVTEDEWDAVWMLTIVKRRKRIDRFIHQALREVVILSRTLKRSSRNLESKDTARMVVCHLQLCTWKTEKGWMKIFLTIPTPRLR